MVTTSDRHSDEVEGGPAFTTVMLDEVDGSAPVNPALQATEVALSADARAVGPVASSYRRGDSVGRYLVLDILGKGSMGAVYSAHDPELDRRVALKLLHPHGRWSGIEARRRLEREARALAKLSHPNVVQVYDAGVHERPAPAGTDPAFSMPTFDVFVAMEYVDGVSLATWQRAEPRPSWPDILRVYLSACRGLAAAHQAGIIHRDIKPSNIMIGSDGRVRVVDFGLAAALDGLPARDSAGGNSSIVEDSGGENSPRQLETRLDEKLTHTGATMGTPAHMAPEQHLGDEVGPAADQYGICVSIYEALHGALPFSSAGSDQDEAMLALLRAKLTGEIAPPAPDSDVPVWITAVLRRGMAAQPKNRYGSMDAFIAALEDDPGVRRRVLRRRVGLGLAALVLTSLALFGWMRGNSEAAVECAGIGTLMAGVWDQSVRQRVRKAFLASGASHAADTVERVMQRLDPYATTWLEMRETQCRTPDDGLAAARAVCMARRRNQLVAFGEIFGGKADGDLVNSAVQAAASLAPLADCMDDEYLAARVPPPDDLAMRELVRELQPRVARLRPLYQAGRYRDGVTEGKTLLAELGQDAHPPLLAEVLYTTARLTKQAGDYTAAEELATNAIHAAARGKHDVLMARGWALLLEIVGNKQQRLDDAAPLMKWMETFAARADDDIAWAEAHSSRGIVLKHRGELEEARLAHQRALAIREQILGPQHLKVASSLNNLGTVLKRMGEYKAAEAAHRRALAIRIQTLGENHPVVASSLGSVGGVLAQQGNYQAARVAHQQALNIRTQTLGKNHPKVATSLNDLGNALENLGNYQAARVAHKQALAIWVDALGTEHPAVADSLHNLGSVLKRQGEYDEAEAAHQQALAIRRQALGKNHPRVASSLHKLGIVLKRQGKYEQARTAHQRALAIREPILGKNHPEVASSLNNLGTVLKRQGKYEQARAVQQRALAIREQTLGPDHPAVATSLNDLGNILKRQGRYEAARTAQERALAIREQTLGKNHPDVSSALIGLGDVLIAQGSLDAAGHTLGRARAIRQENLGPDHPGMAAVLFSQGELALARSRPTRSVELIERALSLGMRDRESEFQFGLARALWSRAAPGDRARAIAVAARARDGFAEQSNEREQAAATAWLAARRRP